MNFDAIESAPFGTLFSEHMAVCRCADGVWGTHALEPVAPISLHPAAHVLHYASEIFEGLKAYKWENGDVCIFRLDEHCARMAHSASLLSLPFPGEAVLYSMIRETVAANRDSIPGAPGSLYIRPALIGTDANVGAAATGPKQALLYILNSPVGSYFKGGIRPLRILVHQELRTPPGFGRAKTGGNYASALRHVLDARQEHQADQVLFCPSQDVQETGASNFLLINDQQVITKPLNDDFLHGITRDSVLKIATSLGYEVIERDLSVDEIIAWCEQGEAALSGTAAVLAGVGTLIIDGKDVVVGDGTVGPNTLKLREALTALQGGGADDAFGWVTKV